MSFWREASIGAAREFGARHYRAFAAVAVVRRVGPAAVALATATVLLAAVALAWDRWGGRAVETAGQAAHLMPLAALVGGLIALGVGATVAVRRWGSVLRMYWPLQHATVWIWCLVMAVGGGAATVIWAQI